MHLNQGDKIRSPNLHGRVGGNNEAERNKTDMDGQYREDKNIGVFVCLCPPLQGRIKVLLGPRHFLICEAEIF